MKFRQNEKNYITILGRLDYFLNMLEEHSAELNNIIWVQCGNGVFSKFFPNIANLFYERFLLRKLIPGIEEGELDDDPPITDGDLYLYDIAQRLSDIGLIGVDFSKDVYKSFGDYHHFDSDCDNDDVYVYSCDSDSDSDFDYDADGDYDLNGGFYEEY